MPGFSSPIAVNKTKKSWLPNILCDRKNQYRSSSLREDSVCIVVDLHSGENVSMSIQTGPTSDLNRYIVLKLKKLSNVPGETII